MSKQSLEIISDLVTEAHTNIQKDFLNINPVVGVNRGMRAVGIPADAMTIDCLKTGKRIIVVLHDDNPEIVQYQFSFKADDPGESFESLKVSELTSNIMYGWMKEYFAVS